MEVDDKERALNLKIEIALNHKDISGAVDGCIAFLKEIYGETAMGLWAMRDFAQHRVNPDIELRSWFDNNLIRTLEARKEKIFGYQKPKYKSPYFENSSLESLDDLFEEYQKRASGKPSKNGFIKLIQEAIDDL